MLGYRMRVSDETELTGPGDCWPCEGGAGISHTVSPRHSSTVHWSGLPALLSRGGQRICTSIGCGRANMPNRMLHKCTKKLST